MPIVAAFYLLCLSPWPQQPPPPPPATNSAPSEPVRRLIELLPPNSMWRNMLEHGARGDGIRQPWMDEMRKQGIKLADLTYEFDWIQGGAELKNWRLVSVEYFTSYNSLGTPAGEPLTDPDQLKAIRASGLEAKLEDLALGRAKAGIWVEDPGHQHPPRESGTGYRWVLLAENEWLPVQMFPWYGQYDAGTTPLMHAALLGNVARVRDLLAQGAGVNASSPNGSTALIYAAASGSPECVRALLLAGADANASMKGGGNALTAAVATDHADNLRLLLKAGADPNSRGPEGESALSLADQRHYPDVARLLRQAGARE